MEANVARCDDVLHGAATGLFSFVMGWLLTFGKGSIILGIWGTVAILLTIPCAALGGYLRGRKRLREIGPAQSGSPLPPIPEP
ncbi:MAG TPA: hypothetical protein VF600_06100 [Abditibacteriaceae bacterium]